MSANTVKAYDSAYPGSMFERKDGDYVERKDAPSLAAALLEQITAARHHAEDTEGALNELREIAKLAYRALCDAEAVINTIDGECTLESIKLEELQARIGDCALHLFTVLRLPTSELRGSAS